MTHYHTTEYGDVPFTPEEETEWAGRDAAATSIDTQRAQIIAVANAKCDQAMAGLKAGYPDSERETWDQQAIEARAWVADNTASTPLLDQLVAYRGIDKSTLVGRVIAKAVLFAGLSGAIVGRRQAIEDAALAATAQADIDVISASINSGWPA